VLYSDAAAAIAQQIASCIASFINKCEVIDEIQEEYRYE
jgi:hypothetical protein